MKNLFSKIGVGRAQPTPPPRPGYDKHLLRSLVLSPWGKDKMRFGYVAKWNGLYWFNAVGIAGPEWNDGRWLGGMSWHKHGPFVVCRHRRRGSWRSDRAFKRAMARADVYDAEKA